MNIAPVGTANEARILLVDDDNLLLRGVGRALSSFGYETKKARSGREAAEIVRRESFDAVITDIRLPDISGIELLRAVRDEDDDLPVILMTAFPDVETVSEAVSLRAFGYLRKPIDGGALRTIVGRAVHSSAVSRMRRHELRLSLERHGAARAELERRFSRAIDSLWMAYQPIVRVEDRSLFGYEALLRSEETSLPNPEAVLGAAEKLGGLSQLGHRIRAAAAGSFAQADEHALLFVNLHARDLADPLLVSSASPLVAMADRVVFEITERASMDTVDENRESVAALRRLGFRIAIDDLGAGYAALTNFASMEPHFAKLDASIVRGVDQNRMKQKIIGSLASLCNELSIIVVAEGVETAGERDVLVDLGCDLLQGYLFGRPQRRLSRLGTTGADSRYQIDHGSSDWPHED